MQKCKLVFYANDCEFVIVAAPVLTSGVGEVAPRTREGARTGAQTSIGEAEG